jgi:hypothetical protein
MHNTPCEYLSTELFVGPGQAAVSEVNYKWEIVNDAERHLKRRWYLEPLLDRRSDKGKSYSAVVRRSAPTTLKQPFNSCKSGRKFSFLPSLLFVFSAR